MKRWIIFLLFLILSMTVLYRHFVLAADLPEGSYPILAGYTLPWKPGESHFCFQGNNSILSHSGRSQYAWDFLMSEGTEVLAAREGTVTVVTDTNEGRGENKANNEIFINHGDGTAARYAHIKKGGAKVKVGDVVARGQLIALSGDVGRSLGPHLHFEVINTKFESIPARFMDVLRHNGVPRTSFFYSAEKN